MNPTKRMSLTVAAGALPAPANRDRGSQQQPRTALDLGESNVAPEINRIALAASVVALVVSSLTAVALLPSPGHAGLDRADGGLQPGSGVNPHQEAAGKCGSATKPGFSMESTIAFSSTRDNPANPAAIDIYLMDPDGTNARRLTDTAVAGEAFAALSPDGKKVVFDSNRNNAPGDPSNIGDLFVMNTDGTEQTLLTDGSSATWSPDCKDVAYAASASGSGTPIHQFPGAPTTDGDIFVANVDDLLTGVEQRRNLTDSPGLIETDADWSPAGSPGGSQVAYTRHPASIPNPTVAVEAEIYALDADGSGLPQQLTDNGTEERSPAWSPDGTKIAFMCGIGGAGNARFEICVMNADGTGLVRLTNNTVFDGGPHWSPDGDQIVFQSPVAPQRNHVFVMNADGTEQTQLTTVGNNLFPTWGEVRVHTPKPAQ